MSGMIGFGIGMFVGFIIGFFIASVFAVSTDGDDREETGAETIHKT